MRSIKHKQEKKKVYLKNKLNKQNKNKKFKTKES